MLLADRGYDTDWIRELAMNKGAWANIPPKSNRSDPICFSPYLYRARNAETVRRLTTARTDDEHRKAKERLSHIGEGGMIEYDRERERRERLFPNDLRKVLIEKDGSIISRAIGREESEMVRYANAILPFASMDNLSAVEMLGLADMFEGWAQSGRTDSINMARLLGWADEFRSLASEVRADYVPPEPPPDAAASLLKFMARKMFEWIGRS